jgi:hypothetical protein
VGQHEVHQKTEIYIYIFLKGKPSSICTVDRQTSMHTKTTIWLLLLLLACHLMPGRTIIIKLILYPPLLNKQSDKS